MGLKSRYCLTCKSLRDALTSTTAGNLETARLTCGHTVYTDISDERIAMRGFNPIGTERICPGCNDTHRVFHESPLTSFCPQCRNDFSLQNNNDAEMLLGMLDSVPSDHLGEVRNNAKSGKRGMTVLPASASSSAPEKPKIDPQVVANAVRMMTGYGITTPLPANLDHPTNYVIAKNGLFEVRDTDIARIIFQPKEVVGLMHELKPGIELKLPRLPYDILTQTVAFFRQVCIREKGSCEAFLRVWWNLAEKKYEVIVPEQRVSGGSVQHTDTTDRDVERDAQGQLKRLLVMDIHSHGSSMNAFWSGIDDADERKAPEGRMFGVIGKVAQPMPDWRWRMRTREGFVDLNVADVFDFTGGESMRIPFTVSLETVMRQAAQGGAQDGKIQLSCPVDPFAEATMPAEWMEQVKSGWSGGSSSAYGRGSGGASTMFPEKQFIYIRQAATGKLEEFEVDATSIRATGKSVDLKDLKERQDGNVH